MSSPSGVVPTRLPLWAQIRLQHGLVDEEELRTLQRLFGQPGGECSTVDARPSTPTVCPDPCKVPCQGKGAVCPDPCKHACQGKGAVCPDPCKVPCQGKGAVCPDPCKHACQGKGAVCPDPCKVPKQTWRDDQ